MQEEQEDKDNAVLPTTVLNKLMPEELKQQVITACGEMASDTKRQLRNRASKVVKANSPAYKLDSGLNELEYAACVSEVEHITEKTLGKRPTGGLLAFISMLILLVYAGMVISFLFGSFQEEIANPLHWWLCIAAGSYYAWFRHRQRRWDREMQANLNTILLSAAKKA